jgi:uncharacterized protein (TIGR03083 family)
MYPISFDPAAVRVAYAAAVKSFLALCAPLQPGDWERPGLEGWSVRLLVGHSARALTTVRDYLAAGANKPLELQHAFDYFPTVMKYFASADATALAARARAAADGMGEDPNRWLEELSRDVLAQVNSTPDEAPLATIVGGMRLIDYLPTRIFELVVHSADLARATGRQYQPDPPAGLIAWAVGAAVAAMSADPTAGLLALTGRGPLPEGYSLVP